MKQSRRNTRNALARAERRAEGKPAVSRYALKTGKETDVHTSPPRSNGVVLRRCVCEGTYPPDATGVFCTNCGEAI